MSFPLADRTFAAVIFDNDGTLVESAGPVQRSWLRWARENDVDPRQLAGSHGLPAAAIIERVAPHLDPAAALEQIESLELADLDGVHALPGVLEALAALAVPVGGPAAFAIATSATRPLARARLTTAGIEEPELLVTVEDVERGKPHPDPFLLAAERLGVDPADCLVCEDAPSGISAAKAAGCAVLAVTTTSPTEELAVADLVVGALDEVRFVREGGRVRITPA